MTPAEVLRKAADVIRERGWCRRQYVDADNSVCVYGALNLAAGHGPSFEGDDPSVDIAARTLTRLLDNDLVSWNDSEACTADEVVAALKEAAELAEGK